MTIKGKNTEILSFSIPKETAHQLENLTQDMGYANRSEVIRDALRMLIKSKADLDKIKGTVEGVVIVIYDHSVEGEVSSIRHKNMDLFTSFMHSDFHERGRKCCDVLLYSGDAERVRGALFDLKGVKGVEEVSLFVA